MDNVRMIEVKQDIHADNEARADELRAQLCLDRTFLLNLMSSPGSGKTTTILSVIAALNGDLAVGVIEADLDSKVDAEKVAAQGIPAIQLKTGGFCHLDAGMVRRGLDGLDVAALDAVIIENVGNLVCPAEFDTGAIRNAMILSVPEGDDKPLKYPLMFTICDLIIINKLDYLSLSDFNIELFKERARRLNPQVEILEICARTGAGVEALADWIRRETSAFLTTGLPAAPTAFARAAQAGKV